MKQPFDLIHSPIDGVNLIEAAAGTGKTFTLTGLYLRLVLEKRLPVEKILVVTYTVAATQELKERIRKRLKEALMAYEQGSSSDPLTAHFLSLDRHSEDRDLLDMAIRSFDQAAVFTILGFCQRMLTENAFESGSLFDTELVTDTEPLFRTVCADFYRRHVYPQTPLFLSFLFVKNVTPSTFADCVKQVAKPGVLLIPDVAWIDPLPLEPSVESAFEMLARSWIENRDTVWDVMTSDPGLSRSKLRTASIPPWFLEMDSYLLSGKNPMDKPKSLEKFTRSFLAGATNKNQKTPEHDVFDLAEELMAALKELETVYQNNLRFLLINAVHEVREQLTLHMHKQGLLSFDDLLSRLHQGLKGPFGKKLEDQIREKFTVALIDEFQDTDPVQYDIFFRIFARNDAILFMIGDPKQAIYSFRGADIFAYMQASENARSGYELGHNYRSDPRLVTAVNTLFGTPARPFVFEAIGFSETRSGLGRDFSVCTMDGQADEPFRIWLIGSGPDKKSLAKGQAGQLVTEAVASEIHRLLCLGREGTALLGNRPVRAGDMAILVRTNNQAKGMKQMLFHWGIPSVIYDTGHVFNTDEALELQRILTAMARPGQEGFVKAALSTSIMGFTSADMVAFESDPRKLEPWLDRFREYHDQWTRYGFIEAYNTLIKDRDVRARLMAGSQGERKNTNLSHMAQLLHQTSLDTEPHPEGLLAWFTEQIQSETGPEEHQLRLERDDEAVRIVTIHKSKGLEYPIVFCPYVWDVKRGRNDDWILFHDPETRALICDMGSPEFESNKQRAQMEALAEDVRLLYVALTRARNRCYMIWGRVSGAEQSAVAHVAAGGGIPEDDESLRRCFSEMEERSGGSIRVEDIPSGAKGDFLADLREKPSLHVRSFNGTIEHQFRITSFSSLASRKGQATEDADRDAATVKKQEPLLDGLSDQKTIFTFPKGAAAGTFLHDIFEHADFRADDGALSELIERKMADYRYDPEWKGCVLDMVRNVLQSPLDQGDPSFALSHISKDRRLVELEFYFPLNRIEPQSLETVFAKHGVPGFSMETQGGHHETRLSFSPVMGYLKGFIDLVFSRESGGVERFYIVDWKSNHLGNSSQDYRPEVLEKVMADEQYMLQYHLYVLAVNRYLTLKLGPSYSYGAHFGGVYYLFLRGINSREKGGNGIYYDLPDQALIKDLEILLWGE